VAVAGAIAATQRMRIAILGNSGSGKSTLARQLAAVHTLPTLDLDTIVWEPGRSPFCETGATAADATVFCESNGLWVTEGCYGGLTQHILAHSPVLLCLEPGVDVSLANCRSRPLEPHKYASKEQQDEELDFLLSWVRVSYTRDDDLLRAHRAVFDAYRGPKHLLAQTVDRAFIDAQPLRWFSHQVDDFAARFQACAIPESAWTHSAHMVLGLWHVHRYGAEEALARLRSGIRRLNESQGGVNTETRGSHETITVAYLRLLAQFLETGPAAPIPDRVAALLASPLAAKRMLSALYSSDRLMSTIARAQWVEPDLAPLQLSSVLVASGV
jgi:adenylate kinase family enzyme